MALYHQLKFPSTLIEYRSVSEWKGVVVITNFYNLEAPPPIQIYRPRQLPSLPRHKFAPVLYYLVCVSTLCDVGTTTKSPNDAFLRSYPRRSVTHGCTKEFQCALY